MTDPPGVVPIKQEQAEEAYAKAAQLQQSQQGEKAVPKTGTPEWQSVVGRCTLGT